jgi:hypothetical protein
MAVAERRSESGGVARTNVGVILCGAFGGPVNPIGMFADGRSAVAMASMTVTAIDVGWGAMVRRGGFYCDGV